MPNSTILIVDNDDDMIRLMEDHLTGQGYSVLTAGSGEQAVMLAKRAMPDLLVLDFVLPGMDGLAVTRHVREDQQTKDIPIIILIPKAKDSDIITSLESGANDVMSAPFSPKELMARIGAILRGQKKRSPHIPNRFNQERDLIIDKAKRSVNIDGEDVSLTLSEFQLLTLLSNKRGWVFTRKQIVDALHGKNNPVADRSVDVMVTGLRKKLKDSAPVIETVRGVGYRFMA